MKELPFAGIVVDCARAEINACIETFNYTTLFDYIKGIFTKNKKWACPVYICVSHFIKTLARNLDKIKTINQTFRTFIILVFSTIIQTEDYETIKRIIATVLRVVAFQTCCAGQVNAYNYLESIQKPHFDVEQVIEHDEELIDDEPFFEEHELKGNPYFKDCITIQERV